jgi:hypothetical protein
MSQKLDLISVKGLYCPYTTSTTKNDQNCTLQQAVSRPFLTGKHIVYLAIQPHQNTHQHSAKRNICTTPQIPTHQTPTPC